MQRVPNWKEIPQYPVISAIAVLAVVVTAAWWTGKDVSPLFESAEIRRGQVWRLVTNVLLHLNIIHLVFNLYWLWVLGTTIERVYGHVRTMLLILFFAVGSSALDFALAAGGVGLSGVGYGPFGLLYVLSHHDERFKDSLDERTVSLFVGWFLVCIFTTLTKVFSVANIARASGALLGVLLGYAIVIPKRRLLAGIGIATLVSFGICGATFARPLVNFSSQGGYEEGKWGYDALIANKNQEAVRWLRDAVKYQPKTAVLWFDLGIAYQRVNNQEAAASAYQRAYQLEPTNRKYAEAASKKAGAN